MLEVILNFILNILGMDTYKILRLFMKVFEKFVYYGYQKLLKKCLTTDKIIPSWTGGSNGKSSDFL